MLSRFACQAPDGFPDIGTLALGTAFSSALLQMRSCSKGNEGFSSSG
jgi:hypothetical protein